MQWDVFVPPNDIPGLIATKDPRFQLVTGAANNPYIVFNTVSQNNNKALQNATSARPSPMPSTGQLVQDGGGPSIAVPLTHVIAPGTDGAGPAGSDYYPYNADKAKQMLTSAGFPHLT